MEVVMLDRATICDFVKVLITKVEQSIYVEPVWVLWSDEDGDFISEIDFLSEDLAWKYVRVMYDIDIKNFDPEKEGFDVRQAFYIIFSHFNGEKQYGGMYFDEHEASYYIEKMRLNLLSIYLDVFNEHILDYYEEERNTDIAFNRDSLPEYINSLWEWLRKIKVGVFDLLKR